MPGVVFPAGRRARVQGDCWGQLSYLPPYQLHISRYVSIVTTEVKTSTELWHDWGPDLFVFARLWCNPSASVNLSCRSSYGTGMEMRRCANIRSTVQIDQLATPTATTVKHWPIYHTVWHREATQGRSTAIFLGKSGKTAPACHADRIREEWSCCQGSKWSADAPGKSVNSSAAIQR